MPPAELVPAHEYLETEDLLELTSAGVIPITVADSHLAAFWSDVLPDLEVHEDLKLATGTRIGWAIRKDATGLKAVLDPWIEANRQGRLLGNVLLKRYLRENRWVRASAGAAEEARLAPILDHFRHYGGRYGFDWMLVAAQGYQESGLDQNKRSAAGAVGIMQLLPSTARDKAVGIPNIDELEPNIHAGTRYLRHIVDSYFDDPAIDESNRMLFAFASYNAGPSKIRRLRREAQAEGLDPNQWFGNVELIAARRIGRETAQYVANIYKYYVAFDLIEGQRTSRAAARAALR
jgi:membrane-bound lytic murein transglycosylase MltF